MSLVKQFDNGLKLGLKPTPAGAVKFKWAHYFDLPALPKAPVKAGHYPLIPTWGMLLNDELGDCAVAGPLHQLMLYFAEAQSALPFAVDDPTALKNYEFFGGYNPSDPSTDGGCNMADVADKWRSRGFEDANGAMHKIAAYVELKAGNVDQLKTSIYLWTAVGIGIDFPNFAMDYFQAGKPWDLPGPGDDDSVEGGHYIPAVGYDDQYVYIVTWGQLFRMTWAFYSRYATTVIAHFSEEMLIKGVSMDGFNDQALNSDIAAVTRLR